MYFFNCHLKKSNARTFKSKKKDTCFFKANILKRQKIMYCKEKNKNIKKQKKIYSTYIPHLQLKRVRCKSCRRPTRLSRCASDLKKKKQICLRGGPQSSVDSLLQRPRTCHRLRSPLQI